MNKNEENLKKENLISELREVIQSSNINFLVGAGISSPFLPLLGNIESKINEARKNEDTNGVVDGYKEYLSRVMLPNQKIIDGTFIVDEWSKESDGWQKNQSQNKEDDFETVFKNYIAFIKTMTNILLQRRSTILTKQANIFTTNIDIFWERAFEYIGTEYNDGFSGRMNPTFGLHNFKKTVSQRSFHYDYRSEIPVFNLFKVHGSLTWKYEDPDCVDDPEKECKIILSRKLEHFDDSLMSKSGGDFEKDYRNSLLVVNPEDAKFSETVLNMCYYELLRAFSSEMERENTVLFVIGFSMADQHIREIVLRAAKSNPTLKIYIFAYSQDTFNDLKTKMYINKNKNIFIVKPEKGCNLSFSKVTESFLKNII